MSRRILVVGGVAGGAGTAARVRRLDEDAEVIMFERGSHVSFSNCSLPYHLSGIVRDCDDLVLMCPSKFAEQYNIDARVNSEVTRINRYEKTIEVKNLETGETYTEKYDKLMLSPGANPIKPGSIKGVNNDNVFTIRNVDDIDKLNQYVKKNNVENVAVIGAGYIGVEIAENFIHSDKNVALVEAMDQVLNPFDFDMAQIIQKELYDNGVNVVLSDPLSEVNDNHVVLKSGKKIDAEAVVLAIGVSPETKLAEDAGLKIGETGGIEVNHNYVTSDPDIYAVGDVIEVYSKIARSKTRLPLAGPAQRQARAAANHMYNIPNKNNGVIGTSVIRAFDYNAAATGLNEKQLKDAGISYDFVYVIPTDKVSLMPDANPLHFKLIYEVPTGKILGAQAIGKGNVDKRIDVMATAILMDATVEDLTESELAYAPLFSTPRNAVNQASLVATNLINNRYNQVPVTKVRELVENDAFIVDVREEDEYEAGHLVNSINIPLSELRERTDEIPKDQPVYLHCRSGQRSYNAVLALQGRGFDNVINVSGSFLGICCYEYFLDQTTDREKIVTEYNFE
ncbi:MAG: FAD-dependent pyridine nucleotide-disulfide oxidoreductase [Halanaerobium sp. 4-GBenrich]|jgi:NADPH-dependent 2,4-dienoyl-CoA reductase/sulfur reductase-like enzyme/rhodanese-related sulfurtransferase|uniref:NADPH-dependent 2,4-dienoyl-CoA reductase, sulfur reductase n=1 Tax=Halanaerobium congolense TaxID=54121 RepID=A0A1G6NRZ0_9FIRM|nr:FAD-dependent oxidoreductase [Halanaerobium congolense]KXS48083.1 MAG: FAD-dependent pyridine nucleotide-disulfide oxidoreductase [Halanaerobium sp. T82-1]ODS50214.1 MAG: FAD-dependent pyridine nucleotide-disulfide oxidoreductase [Halanaerobium sp. 4-GBenrich]PUU90811.1 MAG: FAD-dependent pyridine nucleotide-disulfide oxidoreductase [Halanaerobium sp.]PTX17849.1 NADPH-dependent 2,4-dienoyl-CoA reductase/sulfur reductase-like enzyme [Halanaerobium congolense]PXV63480.1 NADPH-dependent 2,4-di